MTTSGDSATVDTPVDQTPTLRERLAGKHAGPAREDEPHPDDDLGAARGVLPVGDGVTDDGYLRLYPDDEVEFAADEGEAAPTAAERAAAEGRTLPAYAVTFKQRRGTRRFLALLLLVFASATGLATYTAIRDDSGAARGIALTMAVTMALVWASWAATAVARLSIIGGMLEVEQDGVRQIIALSSPYTEIEAHHRPGDPRWKLVFRRHGHPGVVVDSSMVNPSKFLAVLRAYRPEV